MPDCLNYPDCKHLLLEYSFGNELSQDSVYAEDTDKYLKVKVRGKIIQSEFFLELICYQDGACTCAHGERNEREKKNVIHY